MLVYHVVLSRPHGLYPTRLLCPWDSPGENTGVGCHSLLQGIFPHPGIEPVFLCLLLWQAGSLPPAPLGKPSVSWGRDIGATFPFCPSGQPSPGWSLMHWKICSCFFPLKNINLRVSASDVILRKCSKRVLRTSMFSSLLLMHFATENALWKGSSGIYWFIQFTQVMFVNCSVCAYPPLTLHWM